MGIALDIGCGPRKQAGFVGMDIQDIPGVDIIHDCEVTPYPIPNDVCNMVLLSHLVEHMCPKNVVKVMNEIWRITKVGGQLVISMPYAGSRGFWQDPTHCHAWNEGTVVYFDPHPPKTVLNEDPNIFFQTYNPKPWKIVRNSWFETGNIEIILEKRPLSDI
jgi:SAM-dependent methyltransferase